MAKSKRKSSPSKSQTKAKRQKAAPQKRAATLLVMTTEEKFQEVSSLLNTCVSRVNMLQEHIIFIHKKMGQLARLTTEELSKFRCQLQDLEFNCERTREDVHRYQFYPQFEPDMTPPQTPLCMDDVLMSEDALIKAVGDYAEALP